MLHHTGSSSPVVPDSSQNHHAISDEQVAQQEQMDGKSNHNNVEKVSGSFPSTRMSGLSRSSKAKAKRLFNVDGSAVASVSDSKDGVLRSIERDAAFHTAALVKKKHFRPTKTAVKTLSNIRSLGNAVVHPVDSIKSTATRTTAGQLSKAERPFLSQGDDQEYLEAHDNLKQVESSSSSRHGTSDEEQESVIEDHRRRLQEIEARRESLQAAWTTSRHVRRVRVVPKRHINFPDNDYFIEKDKRGEVWRYDWLKWLGYNLIYYSQDFSAQYIEDFDELPFDIDSSRHYVERLVAASAPWQSWAMSVRAVYRWEDPKSTTKWLALYLVLWYTQHMMGFLYCYIIYIVLRNRYFPTLPESIRASMRRALDSQDTASKLSELMDKHGRHEWLDFVMESMGPQIQLQLGDIANILEVFSNFYHWKNPRKTAATLSFFISCLLVTAFADMAFCMKIVWFIVGGTFFLCWPIASLHPEYRYLVSPFKWMLWDIPTHAEWSFQYLRRQAQTAREQMIKENVEEGHFRELANPAVNEYTGCMSTVPRIQVEGDESVEDYGDDDDEGWHSAGSANSVLEASDVRSFRAVSQRTVGRLIVFTKGVRYVRSLPREELWRKDFLDLAELRKVKGSNMSKLTSLSSNQLEIKCVDGSNLLVSGIKERDEAFNTIVAYSGLQWQSLQMKSHTRAQT